MSDNLLIKIANTDIGKKILNKSIQKILMQNQQLVQDKAYLEKMCREYEILLVRERRSHEPIYERCSILEKNNHVFDISNSELRIQIENLQQREAIIETAYMLHYFK